LRGDSKKIFAAAQDAGGFNSGSVKREFDFVRIFVAKPGFAEGHGESPPVFTGEPGINFVQSKVFSQYDCINAVEEGVFPRPHKPEKFAQSDRHRRGTGELGFRSARQIQMVRGQRRVNWLA